jgi:hypothetical protein
MDKDNAVKNAPVGADKKPDKNDRKARRFSALLIAAAVLIICAGAGIIAWTVISNIPNTDSIENVWQENAASCGVMEKVPMPTAGKVDMKRSAFYAMCCDVYIVDISSSDANSYVMSFKEGSYTLAPCSDDTLLDGEVGYILSNPDENIEIRCYKKASSSSNSEYLDYLRIYAVPIPSES